MQVFRSRRRLRGSEVGAINTGRVSAAGSRHGQPAGLRTAGAHSAHGPIIDGLDDSVHVAAVIRTAIIRGRVPWTVPKRHIEVGETPEQAAEREIGKETGGYGARANQCRDMGPTT